ncbi:profilin-1 [Amphiprion ocellaris]|uniref:Profilin n=1 Tax=Amphiprion ocellaris TaxID=80972 RepID=A0A3Q1BCX2_AMPOC|nr:profilin-1 [Amphiprion ocellaris]
MSWDSYIADMMTPDHTGSIPVEQAAICGFTPGQESIWASSDGLKDIKPAEITKLVGDRNNLYQNGVYISGQKCRMLREWMDGEVLIFDLKTAPNDAGEAFSVCVGKTTQALVIAKGTKDALGNQVNAKVCKIAKHLKSSNM